jgi:sulfoxide reductase catalytic subunit YedY
LPAARFVRFVGFDRPTEASRQTKRAAEPWPYTEGLTLAEATNELAFLATGMYGHPLLKQHGAPIRLIVPWKYGYKSAKSIVRIELTDKQPATFWNTLVPWEYDFQANVNPRLPHPRWSQAREHMLGTGESFPTQLYNGYGEWVAGMY